MTRYAFHDLTLEVDAVEGNARVDLDRILDELSWVRAEPSLEEPTLSLSVRAGVPGILVPAEAREVLCADGFRGLESEDDLYLTDGDSVLRLEAREGRGEAWLAPSFLRKPLLLRQNFWIFGLLKLLRPTGIYGLHAAGLVSEDGSGVLIVGESGSGKSTLSIALIRRGWGYLSDDAVLLRARASEVEALALRRHFYVVNAEARDYSDLSLGDERPDSGGGIRRQVGVEAAYPGQRVSVCIPRILLFSRLVRAEKSALRSLDQADALGRLIRQSSSQLFDRKTMAGHLETLHQLLRQSAAYELCAGVDLRADPGVLSQLLEMAERERPCLASS